MHSQSMYSIFVVAVNLHVSPKYDGFQQKMSVQESQFSSLDDFDDITIRVFDALGEELLDLVAANIEIFNTAELQNFNNQHSDECTTPDARVTSYAF